MPEEYDFSATREEVLAMEQLLERKITACFTGQSIDAIKWMIKDDENNLLHWLMQVGLEVELYELCAAVRDVLADRAAVCSGNNDY